MNYMYDHSRKNRPNETEQKQKKNGDFIECYGIDDPKMFIEKMQEITKDHKISSSQLRNIYDEIISIQNYDENSIKKQMAKLIIMVNYACNRNVIKPGFKENAENLFNEVMNNPTKANYEKLRMFFEAFIAFSKGD